MRDHVGFPLIRVDDRTIYGESHVFAMHEHVGL